MRSPETEQRLEHRRTAPFFHRVLSVASWGYLIAVTVIWIIVLLSGDRWWPATMVLFGPRWFAALPLVILLPLAVWRNRRILFPLILAAFIVLGPFMGLCLHLGKVHSSSGQALRVLTCNIQSGDFNPSLLASLIQKMSVDIVALQECPQELKETLPAGWHMVQDGELAVLSRYPLQPGGVMQALHPPHKWPRSCLLYCVVKAPGGDVTFCTVHLPSPRYGLHTILDRTTFLSPSRKGLLVQETAHRWRTAQEVQRVVASLPLPVIIAGDFNMPVDSNIYRQYWGEYVNAFSKSGFGFGLTQWVAVKGIKQGIRIDHVLTGKGLVADNCEAGPDVGSDHLPLLADICRGQ